MSSRACSVEFFVKRNPDHLALFAVGERVPVVDRDARDGAALPDTGTVPQIEPQPPRRLPGRLAVRVDGRREKVFVRLNCVRDRRKLDVREVALFDDALRDIRLPRNDRWFRDRGHRLRFDDDGVVRTPAPLCRHGERLVARG